MRCEKKLHYQADVNELEVFKKPIVQSKPDEYETHQELNDAWLAASKGQPIRAYSHFLGRKKFTTETQRTKR